MQDALAKAALCRWRDLEDRAVPGGPTEYRSTVQGTVGPDDYPGQRAAPSVDTCSLKRCKMVSGGRLLPGARTAALATAFGGVATNGGDGAPALQPPARPP